MYNFEYFSSFMLEFTLHLSAVKFDLIVCSIKPKVKVEVKLNSALCIGPFAFLPNGK